MNQTMDQNPLILTADAILLFTQEKNNLALEKLKLAIKLDAFCFEAWIAQAEILYSMKNFEEALNAAENAHKINPESVHINTTLSRVWIEKSDKKKAEYFSRRARMFGWKEQIKNSKKGCKASTVSN